MQVFSAIPEGSAIAEAFFVHYGEIWLMQGSETHAVGEPTGKKTLHHLPFISERNYLCPAISDQKQPTTPVVTVATPPGKIVPARSWPLDPQT